MSAEAERGGARAEVILSKESCFPRDNKIKTSRYNHCWNNELLATAEEEEYRIY